MQPSSAQKLVLLVEMYMPTFQWTIFMLNISTIWSVTSSDIKNILFFCMICAYIESGNFNQAKTCM